MTIEAIVWDIGGVLIENPDIENFWKGDIESKELREQFRAGKISINQCVSKSAKMLDMSKLKFLRECKKIDIFLELVL